jgi:hypothetical protein
VAGRARLTGSPGWRTLALPAVAVLLLHALTIEWFAREMHYSTVLKPTVDPMFTRLLRPRQPPPATPGAAAQPAPMPAGKGAFTASLKPPRPAASEARVQQAAKAPTEAEEQPVAQPAPEPASEAAQEVQLAAAAAAVEGAAPLPLPQPAAEPEVPPAEPAPPFAAAPASGPAQAASAAPAPDTWPADTRLSYRLSGQFRSGELHGDARVQWQREGGTYQVRVAVDVTVWANLVLTSQGEVTPAGLLPRAYEETRNGKSRAVRLDQTTIVLDKGSVLPRPPGVQDTASQFVELAHRFATGQAPLAVGQAVSLWMARPGGLDHWTYDVVERELLRLPHLGAVEAFHLKPRPIANPRGNITAQMWFAPSLQYLPVRIRVTMGDAAYVDLLAERIEQR